MPNVISSAITNTPPPDALADLLNKRNKIHHLDAETDEDMIPIFTHDVTGKPRNNKRLLNRRNWCSIRLYNPDLSPPGTPSEASFDEPPPPTRRGSLLRRFSSSKGPSYRPDGATSFDEPLPPTRRGSLLRRFSSKGPTYRPDAAASVDRPPLSSTSFFDRQSSTARRGSTDTQRSGILTRTLSLTRKDFMPRNIFRRASTTKRRRENINGYGSDTETDDDEYERQPPVGQRALEVEHSDEEEYVQYGQQPIPVRTRIRGGGTDDPVPPSPINPHRPSAFHRTPTTLSTKQKRDPNAHAVNLEGGLDITLNVEVSPKDPAGITMPYRLLVPRLWYEEQRVGEAAGRMRGGMRRWVGFVKGGKGRWRDHGADEEVGGSPGSGREVEGEGGKRWSGIRGL
jgi:hypothetical protein